MRKLFSYYRSSSSYRVRLALNAKGLSYDYQGVHLVKDGGEQHKPEYKKMNPQALVPTLVDGDFIITQSMAIMEYLEEKYPSPTILPKTPEERAYVRQISLINVADIHPLNNLRVLNHLTVDLGVSQNQKTQWYHKWIRSGFDAIEKLLEKSPYRTGPYVCGDQATMADMCLIPQVYNARRYELDMNPWPLITAIDKHCMQLKTFIDASPENQPDTPEDQRPAFLKGKKS
jgi:maleylacetoacetate isomerase